MSTAKMNTEGLTADDIAALESRPPSIGALLENRVRTDADRIGWMYPDENDDWQELTWLQFRDRVHTFAAGLLTLGVEWEQRLGIIGQTSLQWVIADLANNCIGGATTSVYPNTGADEVEYLLQHSDAKIVVAETLEQADRVLNSEQLRHSVRRVILMRDDAPADGDERLMTWAAVVAAGEQRLADDPTCVTDLIARTGPDTLATLIYTSGTTGRPKGVELTHDNWIFEGASMKVWDILQPEDVHFLWLPMAHVFGKDMIVMDMYHGCTTAVDGRIDKIIENLGKVQPTLMCAAPRIFEKVRAAVITGAPAGTLKGRIARWAFAVGRDSIPYRCEGKPMPKALALKYKVADKLVFSKLKDTMGGRIRLLVSGSAKLNEQIQRWFYSAGLLISEGYGMTETTAIATLNQPREALFGSVGRAAPGTWIKIADDGELLVKGGNVTRGYHNDPEKTAEVLVDGWLHTGDIAEIDADGNVRITDRKKDLIKTSGGKYVSPQDVESAIVANCPYIAQAIAVGEGRKYVSALVVLDPDGLRKFGAKRKLDLSYAELSQLPEIRRSIQRYIDRANGHLEKWATVKRFEILPEELSTEDDTVTQNMKVRRAKVIERYAEQVESMYESEPDL